MKRGVVTPLYFKKLKMYTETDMIAFARFCKKKSKHADPKQVLRGWAKRDKNKITPKDLIFTSVLFVKLVHLVTSYFEVSIRLIFMKNKTPDVIRAKYYIIYYCLEMFNISKPKLAKEFNYNDHAIIYHAERVVKNYSTSKTDLKEFNKIKKMLQKHKLIPNDE